VLLFGVTIPATVPQKSEIPEVLMNYPVFAVILDCRAFARTRGEHKKIFGKRRLYIWNSDEHCSVFTILISKELK